MVDIARATTLKDLGFAPEIIIDDAREALNSLSSRGKKFDVIVMDLFNGGDPAPFLYEDEFYTLSQSILAPDGFMLVNFFKNETDLAPVFAKSFSLWKRLKYKYNRMGVYRHFGRGNFGDPLPSGFLNKEQSLTYLRSLSEPHPTKIIDSGGVLGLRYSWGPFAIEVYTSEKEPALLPWRGIRLAAWVPVSLNGPRKGWCRNFLEENGKQEGYIRLLPDYEQEWSSHAIRHLKRWRRSAGYVLHDASVDDFENAYHGSKKLTFKLRDKRMKEIRRYTEEHPRDVSLYLVRDESNNREMAGLVVTDHPDIGLSVHTIAFMRSEAQKTPVGYGLIHHWYEQSLRKGIRWLSYGLVWKKGDPKEWQGYSQFKRQFSPYLVKYARAYVKATMDFKK